jgi:hypothetical protein
MLVNGHWLRQLKIHRWRSYGCGLLNTAASENQIIHLNVMLAEAGTLMSGC